MYLILCFKSVFAFIFSIIVSKKRLNPCVSLHECRRVFHASIFTLRLALPTKARLLSIFSLESLYPWSKIVQVFSHSKICFFPCFLFLPNLCTFSCQKFLFTYCHCLLYLSAGYLKNNKKLFKPEKRPFFYNRLHPINTLNLLNPKSDQHKFVLVTSTVCETEWS